MTQDAFHRVVRSPRHFTYGTTQPCVLFCEEFLRKTRAPIRPCFHHRPRQFQRAIPYFRNGNFALARSRLVGSSCDSPRYVIEVRPTDFCHPTLCSTSTRTRLLPAHRQGFHPACTPDGLRPSAPENRAFSRRPNRFVDRRARGGVFVPIPRLPNRTTNSDTPVASPTSCVPRDFSRSSRTVRAAKIASTSPAVTRATLSRPKVPSLGR